MRTSTYGLGALLAASTVLATPPEPFKTGWDKPVDPDRDCKFVAKGDTMTIELPGTDHDLAPKRHRFNAPRLLRDVEGDFVMEVRVTASFLPSVQSSVEGEAPSTAAGLVLIHDGKEKCIRMEYGAFRHKGKEHSGVNYRMRGKGYGVEHWGWQVPRKEVKETKEEQIYLRLERRGDKIYHFASPDGEKWINDFNVGPIRHFPKKLKVGLAAYSTSTEPFKATFDQFKLISGQKGKSWLW